MENVLFYEDVFVQIFAFLTVNEVFLKVKVFCKKWNEIVSKGRIFKMSQWINKEPEKVNNDFLKNGKMYFDKKGNTLIKLKVTSHTDWKNSITCFSRAILLNPKDRLSYFWRGYSYVEHNNFIYPFPILQKV